MHGMFDQAKACEEIASGKSLREVASEMGLRSASNFTNLAAIDPEFAAQYARAMELRADYHAHRIESLADAVERKEIAPDAARVAIDARKWTAAKLRPKVYGDRIQADVDMTLRVTVDDPTLRAQVVAQHSLPSKPNAE